MRINVKSQKGAITLIVLVTMLFLMAFLMSLYIRISNKAQTSAETTSEIAKKYNNIGDADIIYNSYFATEDVIPIYTAEQLKKLGSGEQIEIEQEGKIYTFASDGCYILKNDINLNEGNYTVDETDGTITFSEDAEEWIPFTDSFIGTLDGLGHEIKGLYLENTDSTTGMFNGMLKKTSASTIIKNLGVVDSYVKGTQNVGSIVGENHGTIENCYTKGSVAVANMNVGGIAGVNSGNIINSYSESIVVNEASANTGGIVGDNSGVIRGCYNEGEIVPKQNSTGGISGANSGLIENSYNLVDIIPENNYMYLGGISGSNNSTGIIKNCYNLGDIQGTQFTSGISGSNNGTISLCYNLGDVTGKNIHTGGIACWNKGTIEKCYNEGTISGTVYVGGIVSYNQKKVGECFNKGILYKGSYIGGIVGQNVSEVINCYNVGEIQSTNTNLGGIIGCNGDASSNSSVLNCYNSGLIYGSTTTSGIASVGAIVGTNSAASTVSNCYSLENMHANLIGTDSGTTNNSIFKTGTEMKATDGSFIALLNKGLNPTVWIENTNIELNDGYPILSWQSE